MKNKYVFLWLILLGFTAYSNTVKLEIAVNDLEGRGVKVSDAGIISERLRSELLNTGLFKVMERNSMSEILKEQGFQHTGACNESSCIVEVGQLLGVERMVAGSIGKIDNMYTISLRMLNVATGEILFTVNEDYAGRISGVLTTAVKNVALKLARGAGGEVVKASLAGKTGDLYITSTPSGATVSIDGKAIQGETPITLQGISVGEHRIVLLKDEYYGARTINLSTDDLLKLDIEMERGKGSLKVFSKPDGVSVIIDGVEEGTTPCKIDNIQAGEHILELAKKDYLPQKSIVAVGINETNTLSINLKSSAYITVSSSIEKSRILINGKDVGTLGRVKYYKVGVGNVLVSVEAPGYEPFSKNLTLKAGQHEIVTAQLVSVFGQLNVTTKPSGADVFLNEKQVGTTPYFNDRLQPGNVKLKVLLDSYEPIKTNISIVKNTSVEKEFKLKHSSEYLDSIKAFEAKAKKRVQWIRRIGFGVGTLVAGGAGAYYNDEAKTALLKYRENKHPESYADEWNEFEEKSKKRNILYVLAGVFGVCFAVSIPF